jgi:hypothetical protein
VRGAQTSRPRARALEDEEEHTHAHGKRGTGRVSGVVVVGEVRRAGWGRMVGQGVTSSGVETRMVIGWYGTRQWAVGCVGIARTD